MVGATAFTVSGCFFYDSRWGQSTTEQKHAAARLRPASIGAPSQPSELRRRVASIRACATRAYAAETLRWEERFEELLREANSVLEPLLGLTLRSAGTTLWEPPRGEGSLESVVAELSGCEGKEADWVVALVQSTPKVATDFHTLGMGQLYSKYLVMRAPNDPAELDALTRALPDLDEATRQKLYSDRKHHKVLTLFLHELGHTLGGVHRSAKDTIMSPMYDASERGYDEATLGIFRITLPARLEGTNPFGDVRAYLERTKGGWIEAERGREVERLTQAANAAPQRRRQMTSPEPSTTAPATAAAAPKPLPSAEPLGFETLSKEERQAFNHALSLEPNDARAAWHAAERLFESHPAVRPVQALRCRLAKARNFYPAVIEGHCARLGSLGPETEPLR